MNFFKVVPGLVLNFVPRLCIAPLVAAGLVGAAGSLISSGINFFSQKKSNDQNASVAQQNFLQQQANLDYQKAVQQQTWQREDTAWQRAVSDIQKTGMSPLALSGGASTSTPVSTTAAQNNFVSTAPQVDSGSIGNAAQMAFQGIQANKQLKLQTQTMENQVKQQKIDNAMKMLEFNEMKRQFDLGYESNERWRGDTSALNWSELERKLAADAEQSRQFDLRLSHDDSLFAWQKQQAIDAATRWEKEFKRDEKRYNDNSYMREAEYDLKSEQADYQRNINSYFKSDKTINLLLRALALMK